MVFVINRYAESLNKDGICILSSMPVVQKSFSNVSRSSYSRSRFALQGSRSKTAHFTSLCVYHGGIPEAKSSMRNFLQGAKVALTPPMFPSRDLAVSFTISNKASDTCFISLIVFHCQLLPRVHFVTLDKRLLLANVNQASENYDIFQLVLIAVTDGAIDACTTYSTKHNVRSIRTAENEWECGMFRA